MPQPLHVLRKAAVQQNGQRLGVVGGRIVAEVLIALLQADPTAYLNIRPDGQPTLPARNGAFTIADLLRTAEVA